MKTHTGLLLVLCLLCLFVLTVFAAQVSEERTLYTVVGKCPEKDGDYPVYLPDSHNKTIFYECSKGIPWPLNCPPKTIFDPSRNVCVHDSQKD